jgi:hypothetical protein
MFFLQILQTPRFLLLGVIVLLGMAPVTLEAAAGLSAVATMTHRGIKPGGRVELVVTVRNASHPVIAAIERPSDLYIRALHRPQRLLVGEGEEVWLFRYRVIPSRVGDYELPPITVRDGARVIETNPLLLHVSLKGEAPPLSAGELSLDVNIPGSLSEEVLKTAPQPTPRAEPSPPPADMRPWTSKVLSTSWKELKAFWNYPGK